MNLGGYVMEPHTGLYEHVLVCDFKSLYPSLIRTFQIDPLGFLEQPGVEDDAIVAPNGAAFRRRPGILPALLDELFPRREAAKANGDKVASHAIKILMNSFYGVLGAPACRPLEGGRGLCRRRPPGAHRTGKVRRAGRPASDRANEIAACSIYSSESCC